MKKLALAASLLLTSLVALPQAGADQCAFVTQEEADGAAALIEVGSTIVAFCQPCGDAPVTVRVNSVTKAETGFEGTWEVSVNGEGIDLAYTFVENGDGNYVNLSKMVDCPSSDVACMLGPELAVLEAAGRTCEGEKEDSLGSSSAGGGCSVGTRAPAGSPWLLAGLGLAGMLVRRRRRDA